MPAALASRQPEVDARDQDPRATLDYVAIRRVLLRAVNVSALPFGFERQRAQSTSLVAVSFALFAASHGPAEA